MRKGFTLVELMIVMAIVAMLSTLSVNGYLQYRKSTVLALSIDDFLSQVAQLRAETIYGEVEGKRLKEIEESRAASEKEIAFGEVQVVCKGLYFSDGVFRSFEQSFSDKYFWNGNEWIYEGCSGEMIFSELELDDQIKFDFDKDFYLRFVPPFASIESDVGLDLLELNMYYGSNSDVSVPIFFDVKNGKFGRK